MDGLSSNKDVTSELLKEVIKDRRLTKADLNGCLIESITDELVDCWDFEEQDYKKSLYQINGMILLYNEIMRRMSQ